MSKIRILIVEPNKEPRQAKIEHTLHDLQSIVGGLIEYVELEYNVDLICNEEGKIDNLELNRFITNDIIAGTFILAFGINFFLVPIKISTGGVSGIATTLFYIFKLPFILIINFF